MILKDEESGWATSTYRRAVGVVSKFEANRYGLLLRVRGYGLTIEKDRTISFVERGGWRTVYRLGRWSLEFLKPGAQ